MSGGSPSDLGAISRVDALVARIHDRVVSGELAPGELVTEAMLGQEFGVSRPTARSAVAAAVTLGLLAQDPNKPAVVPIVTGERVRDLFRVRIPLELEAARMLASHEVALADSVRVAAAHLTTLGEVPLHAFAEHDLRFHRELVSSTGSPLLLHHWSLLERQLLMAIVQARLPMEPARVAAEHLAIVDAVERGSADLAHSLTFDHLANARDSIAFRVSVGAWDVQR